MSAERCSWCGSTVEPGGAFHAYEPAGARRAIFCRLEHVVPWAIRGAYWDPAEAGEAADVDASVESCSWCGAELAEAHVLVVHDRGELRVPDGFCSVAHLLEWAKRGGRYAG